MTQPSHQAFHLEVIKVLLKIAKSDHLLEQAEVDALWSYADRVRLGESERQELERLLQGDEPLPKIRFDILCTRRQDVMIAVQQLLLTDLQVPTSEREVLRQLETALDQAQAVADGVKI